METKKNASEIKSHLTNLLFLICVFIFNPINAQVLPDIITENTSAAHYYYANNGQIIDNSGNIRNDILYYTERTQPAVYLASDKAYFVVSRKNNINSNTYYTYRIDLEFVCNPSAQIKTNGAPSRKINTYSKNDVSPCGTLTSYEQGHDYLNYYLAHCSGGVTDVLGYQRIVYENAFSNIDFHFYSNLAGLKSYIVVKPGGNPNDILLKFSGQDSIHVLDSSDLQLYLVAGASFSIPQATVYQIDNSNNPINVDWNPVWVSLGGGYVSLQTQSYDHGLPLVIRIVDVGIIGLGKTSNGLHWSTYYGGNAVDGVQDLATDENANLYQTSLTSSSNFPQANGFQTFIGGGSDAYISKFDNGSSRQWATYYGGTGDETPNKIAINSYFSNVYVIGNVNALSSGGNYISDMPMASPNNGTFIQSSYGGGNSDAFLIAMDKSTGHLNWTSYFGGSGDDYGTSLALRAIDGTTKSIYPTGFTTSTTFTSTCSPSAGRFPICSNLTYGFNQNFNNGNQDAFVAELDANHALIWSTLFGGEANDVASSVAVTIDNSDLIIGGFTTSTHVPAKITSPYTPMNNGEFPIAGNTSSKSYIQTTRNNSLFEGFISRFDNSKNLVWSTFYGGDGDDMFGSVAFNSDKTIYATGGTSSAQSQTGCIANTKGEIPICNSNGSSYIQTSFGGGGSDQIITQFSLSGELKWSTYYGGAGNEPYYNLYGNLNYTTKEGGSIAIDNYNNLFIAASTGHNGSPYTISGSGQNTLNLSNFYNQSQNSSQSEPRYFYDGFVLAFNNSNQRQWASFFGGGCNCTTYNPLDNPADETIDGIAVTSGSLFIGGRAHNQKSSTPYQCPGQTTTAPFCNNARSGSYDGFLTRFDIGQYSLGIKEWLSEKINFKVYPNPVNDLLNIEIPFTEIGKAIVKIFDIEGKLILTKTVSGQVGIEKYEFNVSNLNSGMYFISVTNDKTYATKFVK